ncbi:hypothetical protein H5410_005775 [Solanum commersonii]|uniref:Uncharacterized protein n=1 Tax=Solanum commersonii TaxID=4109 RepID=A0A9J6A7K0_SOLCO|nr:hypothetical protein H5410_005775 [Solanum commersonii]
MALSRSGSYYVSFIMAVSSSGSCCVSFGAVCSLEVYMWLALGKLRTYNGAKTRVRTTRDEMCRGINDRMEVWRQTIESKGFRPSRTKTKYLECKFNDVTYETKVKVKIDA